ncbi:MFS transporter [Nocardioides sp. cx-169]|uniref:MFS transporter n=1 Tax=Nocardioides sp. cx-169 TaxID=2899080 RepID=UPI001E59C736|nr:MFS transporter [Nocardioides sp. cx-169]MCD4533654.1 MFS transporter [Nocardioides sp. cx-169]
MTSVRTAARVRLVVMVLALAGVLVALVATLIVPLVAHLPEVFDVSPVAASWLLTSTLVAGAVATPIMSRLADQHGKRPMLLISLALLVLGSLLLATSSSFVLAVAGRSLQGFGSALIPIAMSILKDVLPAERVGSGVALVSATLGLGSAIGLPLAGVLYGATGWSGLFWLTGGLGLLLMVAVRAVLPAPARGSRVRHAFDWWGAALLLCVLVPLLLVVSQGNTWGWDSPRILVLGPVATVALAAWVLWERRAPAPLIDVRLAVRRRVLLTNLASAAVSLGMLANLLVAAGQLGAPESVGGFGLSTGGIGLAAAAPAVVLVLSAPLVGRLLRVFGGRWVLSVGALVMAVSYVARVFLDGSVPQVVLGAALVSIGTSFCLSAIPIIIMAAVPSRQTASANGVNSLFRTIGTSVSTAGLAALTSATAVVAGGLEYPSVQSHHIALLSCASAALVAAGLAWAIPRTPEAAARPGSDALIAVPGVPGEIVELT